MSLIKILKSRGLRKDYWGILLETLAKSLYEEPILSFVFENVTNH